MANNLQPTYSDTIRRGFPGMVANSENLNVISRTVASATAAFGALALLGDDAHTVISASAETVEASAPAAQAGNTGNGTFLATPTITAGTPQGAYHLEIVDTATDAGDFLLTGPGGYSEAGTVAVAFNKGGIAFTLQDGSTDFAVGDGFDFDVQATSATDVGKVAGIFRADTTLGAEVANYREYDTAAVITRGSVYVTAAGAVAEGDPVYFVVSSGRYTNVAGAGNIEVPGAEFAEDAAAAADIVAVSLLNRLI